MKHSGLLALSLTALLSACATTGGDTTAPPASAALTNEAYRIGVDDVVQVSVWRNPDLSTTAPVRPDGMISVPLVGDVQAGGRAPSEVADDIEKKLGAYVVDPQVAVILTELNSHEYLSRVRVTGAVRTPVSIPYRQGMTVLDAVLAAGGPTEFAAADRASLHRKNGENTGTYQLRLDSVLNQGDLASNYKVAPGDVIVVPERTL